MKSRRPVIKLLALLAGLVLLTAACGGGADDADEPGGAQEDAPKTQKGGELVDGGTFVGDPPEHIDPALNSTLDAYQVINAMYDGLTEPTGAEVKPLVAESVESNDDASVWTFKIREGMKFSNGEEIKPTTFQKSWERASNPDFAGDYAYLFNFIKGGKEKLDGKAKTLEGVAADDGAGTLTVTLASPYSNFDAVAGFQTFFPMPDEATSDPAKFTAYENGLMIGNGPYKLEKPRTDQEISLVKNDTWTGDVDGEKWEDRLDRIRFLVNADPDTSYNALGAGEVDTANIPPARVSDAEANWGNTLDVAILGSYHYVINGRNPIIGGEKNKLLRQAISQAIDREEINEAVYNGSRTSSTGITPDGIPGFKEGICKYCKYDLEAAKKAFADWQAAGNKLAAPIQIQFNADAGHEPVVQIFVDNLKEVGIQAAAQPFPTETYFSQLADGACVICRTGWFADYPTYDNFMYDLFHSDSLDGNTYGFVNEEFDGLVDKAKATVDKDEQAKLFQQAEDVLLNKEIMAIPINWYKGDYAFDKDKIAKFPQSNFGLIAWEQVALAA
ncbi:MAG TPA: ABC transporter substrate-binding protein [Acidimicrobiales bacterium]|nr:ABC transporter substrate-binding protein [Acidimicrobiales bacterium]